MHLLHLIRSPRLAPAIYSRGIATLPIVLALGILILATIIGISAMTFSEGFVAQGNTLSAKARAYAEAGARDALVRIARQKTYFCDTPALPTGCYSIDMTTNGCSTNDGCARVTVSSATAPKVILSEGRASNYTRRVQVSVTFDGSGNGEITSTSWQEINN